MICVNFKIIFAVCLISLLPKEIVSGKVPQQLLDNPEELAKYATAENTCGGLIESHVEELYVLEYKVGQEYDNNELCVWVIRNGDCNGVLISKTESNFEVDYDYLQVSYFRTVGYGGPVINQQLGNITGVQQVSGLGDVVFVIFSSDASNVGTGFRLEIVGYSPRASPFVYEDYRSNEPSGAISVEPYRHRTFSSYLIELPYGSDKTLVLSVDYVTEPSYDYVSVYQLERNGRTINFKEDGVRLSGVGNFTFEAIYYTTYLVFFKSDGSGVPAGARYDMNWHLA